MKKVIFSVLTIGLSVGAFVACSSDEMSEQNSNGHNKNLSKSEKSNSLFERKYPQYEDIKFTSEQVKEKLGAFNEAMNSETKALWDMDVKEALFIMEAYLNYGVIEKVNAKGKIGNDKLETFTMTLPINNGVIDGGTLKDAYFSFVVNFLSVMTGKIMPLSDMYVKEISANSVTFAVDTKDLPYVGDGNNEEEVRYSFPRLYSLNELERINIPSDVVSPWTDWINTLPHGIKYYFEENVYKYSMKSFRETMRDEVDVYYTGVQYFRNNTEDLSMRYYAYRTDTMPSTEVVSFDYLEIKNILIPAMLSILQRIITSGEVPAGKVLVDYKPFIEEKPWLWVDESKYYFMYCREWVAAERHVMQYNSAITISFPTIY